MSAKNLDSKGRFRNETIAFRLSPEERKELDNRVKLSGFQTKQDYMLQSVMTSKVIAKGNPLMFMKFKKHLTLILEELRRINSMDEVEDEFFTPVKLMLEIIESFSDSKIS